MFSLNAIEWNTEDNVFRQLPKDLEIFFDMDGVLADFVGGVCNLYGLNRRETLDSWPKGEYSISKVLGVTEVEMWNRIDATPNFWEDLNALAFGVSLFKDCIAAGFEPWVATRPSLSPSSARGKVAWLQSHFGRDFRQYHLTCDKSHLAKPNRFLIEDSVTECHNWMLGGGGGWILIPQPWNAGQSEQYMQTMSQTGGHA